MSPVQGGGAFGQDISLGPVIEKMRHDNDFSDEVHDPSEDEPHLVGIPKKYRAPEGSSDHDVDSASGTASKESSPGPHS